MMTRPPAAGPGPWILAGVLCGLLVAGCASSSVNWDQRVGLYSWDDAVTELGLPDRVADLDGGVKAAEWITPRTTADSVTPSTAAVVFTKAASSEGNRAVR